MDIKFPHLMSSRQNPVKLSFWSDSWGHLKNWNPARPPSQVEMNESWQQLVWQVVKGSARWPNDLCDLGFLWGIPTSSRCKETLQSFLLCVLQHSEDTPWSIFSYNRSLVNVTFPYPIWTFLLNHFPIFPDEFTSTYFKMCHFLCNFSLFTFQQSSLWTPSSSLSFLLGI